MNRCIWAEHVCGYDVGASGYFAVIATVSLEMFFFYWTLHAPRPPPHNMDIRNPTRRPEVDLSTGSSCRRYSRCIGHEWSALRKNGLYRCVEHVLPNPYV